MCPENRVRLHLKQRGVYTLIVDDVTGVESEKTLGACSASPRRPRYSEQAQRWSFGRYRPSRKVPTSATT
jgi:hypothetical protein